MTHLTYNEAYDPYHAVFRLVRLHLACDLGQTVAFDMVRVLDFYLLFPFRLQAMKLLAEDTAWRKISRGYEGQAPYGMMPDDNSIFASMEPFQRAAVTSLVHSGHLSAEAWEVNEIAFTGSDFPAEVTARCADLNSKMADILDALSQIRARYTLGGRDGLKDRTGLLEYRYDPV